jgi:pyruvate formate lyase activating enzyme
MSVKIANIQRFSLDDGPGIRTTVFLFGCGLHCPWCSNPETLYPNTRVREYNDDELLKVLLKDKNFYTQGGITFSGGEPLLQIDKLTATLSFLKKEKIDIAFETSLFVDRQKVTEMLLFANRIFIDLKTIVNEKYLVDKYQNYPNVWRSNMETLVKEKNENQTIIIRMIANKLTTTPEDMESKYALLSRFLPYINGIEIMPTHSFAKAKYESLGLNFIDYSLDSAKYAQILFDFLHNKKIKATCLTL